MTNAAQKRFVAAWSVLETYFVCGVVFGWPNLKKIFIEENIFCNGSELELHSNETSLDITARVYSAQNLSTTIAPTTILNSQNESLECSNCSCQETKLTDAYTYACVVFALLGVPIGTMFDKFGTMTTRLIGASLFLFGNILLLSVQNNHSLLYPALCLVACSGLFFLTCQQQSGNLFDESRGKVLSMINGAMDSSSSFALALFTIYSYAGFKMTFMVFGAFSILIVIRTLLFYTKTSIPYPLPQNYEIDPPIGFCLPKKNSHSDRIIEEEKSALEETSSESIEEDGTNEIVPEFFSMEVFLSPLYASSVLFFVTQVYRVYIFLATMSNSTAEIILKQNHTVIDLPSENYRIDDTEAMNIANDMVTSFGLVQALGVMFAPLNGFIIDKLMVKTEGAKYKTLCVSMFCCTFLGSLFSFIAVLPFANLQYAAFLFSVIHRAFVYSGNAAVIAMCFPPQYFGKLYGFSQFATALSGQLISPTFAWAKSTSFRNVNIILLFIEIGTIWHAGILFYYSRKSKKSKSTKISMLDETENCRDEKILDSNQNE